VGDKGGVGGGEEKLGEMLGVGWEGGWWCGAGGGLACCGCGIGISISISIGIGITITITIRKAASVETIAKAAPDFLSS